MVNPARLITVGRPRDPRLAGLVEEYLKRMQPSVGLHWIVVPEEPFRKGGESHAREREQQRLLDRISAQDYVVLLDVVGDMVDSQELAKRLDHWRTSAKPWALVVGGSLGVGERVRARAQWRWSLSPLTLPHALAHLLVVEQIYRASTILAGHPYHKS